MNTTAPAISPFADFDMEKLKFTASRFSDYQFAREISQMLCQAFPTVAAWMAYEEQIAIASAQEFYGVMSTKDVAIRWVGAAKQNKLKVIFDHARGLTIRDGTEFSHLPTAQDSHPVSMTYNSYNFGDVSGSQIQIESNGSSQSQQQPNADLQSLRALIDLLQGVLNRQEISGDHYEELRSEVAVLQAQSTSPKPKWPIIQETAKSIRSILESAAPEVISTMVSACLTMLAK